MLNIVALTSNLEQLVDTPLMTVEGDRYQLQLLQRSDAAALFSVIDGNRDYLRRWLPWLDGTRSPHDSEQFIIQSCQSLAQNTGLVLAIVATRETAPVCVEQPAESAAPMATKRSAIAGIVGLEPIDWPSRTGYIGYWLAEDYQGQGIMTIACQKLIEHAFTLLQLNRVVIACATENTQSRAIPERLGFAYDGRIKQTEWLYNHYVDHEVYVMLRESCGSV